VTDRRTAGFVAGALAVSAIGALAIFRSGVWAYAGFLAMAVPGIVTGTWLVRAHGRAGSRFAVGLGAGFVARLVLAAVAASLAARAGGAAGTALLTGLAAGFVPLFLFETAWFLRKAATVDAARGGMR
jgi:hypothetical protein